jgi:retinol dehydrogenase 12
MGHFLLFRRLLGALQAAPEARVLTLSSAAHYIGKLRFESFQGDKVQVKGMQGYAQSKLANTLFAREVARRYPAVRSYSLHPGLVASEFVSPEENGWLFTLGWKLIRPFSLSSRQGANPTIHLATVSPPPEPNGQFFHRLSRAGSPSPLAKDDELANALWEESERLWRERGVVF